MKKSTPFLPCGFFLLLLAGWLLSGSCANKGYPEGGPRDETPPRVVAEVPVSYATGFDRKYVDIYFDEYVTLKEITEKFIISPPQAKKPKVNLRGKYIRVEFQDSLRIETTYSLDFADAIVDNNESNPLGYYRYVFSTGAKIDTLELGGVLVDATSNEPVSGVPVFLYEGLADTMPLKGIPNYVGRTDSVGRFRITNLKEAAYRVMAVVDDNRDHKFTPGAEKAGFTDSLIRPEVLRVTVTDTLEGDSVVVIEKEIYGPNDLQVRLFQEDPTQLYLTNEERKERELLTFTFSIPGRNDFSIRLADSIPPEDWYFPEISPGLDSINIWIKDSTVYKRDTLYVLLDYLRTDSTGRQSPYADTLRMTFSDKKKPRPGNRRKEEEKPVVDFIKINVRVSGEQHINKSLAVEFDRPITGSPAGKIRLEERSDTLYLPAEAEWEQDSSNLRRFFLKKKWQPEGDYRLVADSAAITDIYGRHSDKLERKFKVRAEDSYGSIHVDLKGTEGPVILQLYRSDGRKSNRGDKKFNVLAEKTVQKDGVYIFDYLDEGQYRLRAVLDRNGNGKWDTGLYEELRQPEEIRYLPVEIRARKNFDIEQTFDLNSPYRGGELLQDDSDPNKKTNLR